MQIRVSFLIEGGDICVNKEELTKKLIMEDGGVLIKVESSENPALLNDTFYTVDDFNKIIQSEETKKAESYRKLSSGELSPVAELVKYHIVISKYYGNIEGLNDETQETAIGKGLDNIVTHTESFNYGIADMMKIEMMKQSDPTYSFEREKLVYKLNHINQELTYHNTIESLENHKNMYIELKEKHQKELDDFPWFVAFDDEQFNLGMEKLGLTPEDSSQVMAVPPGIIIKQSDNQAYFDMFQRWTSEHLSEIMKDDTGLGYIYDMFSCELKNHGYGYSEGTEETLLALNITPSLLESSDTLKTGFELAKLSSFIYDDGTSKLKNMIENGEIVYIYQTGYKKYVLSASMDYENNDFKYNVKCLHFSSGGLDGKGFHLSGQGRYCRNIDDVRKYVIEEVHRTDIEDYILTGKNRFISTGESGNDLSSGAEI